MMARHGWLALCVMVGCAASLDGAAVRRMAAAGDTAAVVEALHASPDPRVRTAALSALTRTPEDPIAFAALLEFAERGSPDERRLALPALGGSEDSAALGVLVEALGDPALSIRELARAALARTGGAAVPALAQASHTHPNPFVRAEALGLLGARARSGASDEGVRAALMAGLSDPSPKVRARALEGLGTIEAKEVRPEVARIARADGDRMVRIAAQRALTQLGGDQAAVPVVAVLPVRPVPETPELSNLAATLTDVLRARLSDSPGCEVIDREKMETVLAELRKAGDMVYDGDGLSAPAIGKFRIANELAYGSVALQRGVYTIVLQRVEVATLGLIEGGAVAVRGYRSELDGLMEEAVAQLVETYR